MTPLSPELNVIACQRCRLKKIRCERQKPACKQCRRISVDCIYEPPRYGKRKHGAISGSSGNTPAPLKSSRIPDILHQLDALQETSWNTAASPVSRLSTNIPNYSSGNQLSSRSSKLNTESYASARRVNLKEYKFHANPVTNASDVEIFIPSQRAVSWVQTLYDNQSTLGLLLPISKEFMLTIPSIIDNPYIQVDVRVLILYHGALNQGMLLSPDLSPSDKKEYSLFLYRTTLRLMEEWQLQDQANELSLHVAFWMSHEAYSQLDFDLSYRLHVCACEIARDLGILQLDSENPVPSSTSSEIFSRSPDNLRWPEDDMGKIHRDIHRIYFWHILITNDYSFQNHLYRLGSIDAGTWKVGLPDFSSSLSLSNINRDTEVYFQVSLRISLIEMKYSELVHGSPSCRSAGGFLDDAGHVKLRQLLLEIATVLSEWQVEQLLMQVTSKINAGFYAILIWRTTSMINSFLRTQPYSSKWPIEQDTILEHEAAHRSVKALQRLFALHVNEGDLFWMFGHLKCFFTPALGVLFGSILASTTEETAASDLSLLSRAQSIISSCANKRQELKSLELYIGTLNHLLRLALRRGFPSRLQPLTQPYWEEQRYNDRFCQSLRRDQYRSKPFESGNSSPGPLAPDLLHEDEIGLLHRCGITATELYHDPYREVLIMQKMLLTEPDPHRQWWAFETQT